MKRRLMASLSLLSVALSQSAHAEPKPVAPAADPNAHTHEVVTFGVSLASLVAREGEDRGQAWAVLLSLNEHLVGTRGSLTTRLDRYLAIGGGDHGFVGDFDLSAALGYRYSIGPNHGPLGRAGLGLWSGWSSWLAVDLPELELGYQVLTPTLWLDVGARGALTLGLANLHSGKSSGRDGAVRPATGAYLRAGMPGLELTVDAKLMRRNTDQSDLPFSLIQWDLCSTQGIAVCTRFMHMNADVHHASGAVREQTWDSVQLVVGVGLHGGR